MSGETVADIELGRTDKNGLAIEAIYHKVDRTYVIYANTARLAIQYADEETLAKEQRLALAHLAPLRGEINGLIDGWRSGMQRLFRKRRDIAVQARARRYDRRTADALVVALQGDQASAEVLLQGIKTEIIDERTSTGRAVYIAFAGVAALVVFAVLGLLDWWGHPAFVSDLHLWKMASLGCLGAFFSIATMTNNRTIRSDLRTRDNIIDASIRILIGAISSIVLLSLYRTGIVSFDIGNLGASEENPHFLIIVGFLAGFSERLVGDLLTTQVEGAVRAVASTRTPASIAAETAGAAEGKGVANETNPLGRIAATTEAQKPDDPYPGDEDTDASISETDWDQSEATDDTELPTATGGVETKP